MKGLLEVRRAGKRESLSLSLSLSLSHPLSLSLSLRLAAQRSELEPTHASLLPQSPDHSSEVLTITLMTPLR